MVIPYEIEFLAKASVYGTLGSKRLDINILRLTQTLEVN